MAETRVVITAEANQAIQEFNRLRDQARQSLNQMGQGATQLNNLGMSAAQTAAVLRQVPAQFTDIVVSLQAGQNPFTVFLQQGGQLRDMFGSSGAAARALGGYILSLINPYTLLAAAAAAVALAYYQGSKEADAYTRAITMSGNAAGVSKDQLAGMAREIRKGGDTQAAGAAALAALVDTGRVGRENLQAFATTAIKSEKSIGIAVADTVKNFADLGKSPVEASLRLNERYNYLTASVYDQIRALERKGEIDAAGEVAQQAYSAAMNGRSDSLKENLGTLEAAWSGVKKAAAWAWDSMLDIGREDTLDQKIEAVKKKINNIKLEQMSFVGSSRENRAESDVRKAALQQELDGLQKKKQADRESSENAAKAVALEQAKIKWSQDGEKFLTRRQQLENAIAKAQAEGAAAGKSEQEIRERVAQVEKSFSDIANDSINAQIEAIKRRGNVEDVITRRSMDLLVSKHNVGLVNEQDFIAQVTQMDLAAFDKAKTRVQEELALTAKKQNSEKDQAALRGQLAELDAQRASRKLQGENQLYELEVRASRLAADNFASVVEKQDDAARQLADQVTAQRDANDQIGLTKEGLVQLTAMRLRDRAALADQNATQAESADFSGRLAETYRRQAQSLRELADAQVSGAGKSAIADKFSAKDLEDFLDPSKAKTFGESLKDAFGGAGDALTKLRASLQDYGIAQTTIERARAAAAVAYANDSTKLASANIVISRKEAQARAGAYGDMAGAAKGFFHQHTAGYKVLEATEKAFRLFELAMAAESMVKKIFFKEGEVAANVALNATKLSGEAATTGASVTLAGTEASAWGITAVVKAMASLPFPLNLAAGAATLAAVLAIGAKVLGGGGGGGIDIAKQRQETQGTGSVLGAESAKSESIGRSIENLEKYADIELSHTRDMLSALVKIRDTIGVVAAMATQTSGLRATALDEKKYGVGSSSGVLGIGASSTTIQDSGIKLNGSQTIGSAISGGVDATGYADILKKKSGLWGIGSSSKTSRDVIQLDDDLKNQFGLLVGSMRDGAVEAVKVLGLSTDGILEKINGMALGINEISFKGLTGAEIQKELEAVFSKVGDDIAKLAVPELAKFQQVGEGYLETLTRVATDYATIDSVMEASGRTFGAVGLASIEARERLIKLAGGLDNLISTSQSFNDNFLTEAERLAPVQNYVTTELSKMGLQGVTTREQFKGVVLGLDVTTEAGAKQYAAMLALADAFAKTHAATEVLKMSEQELKDQRKEFTNQYDELMLTTAQLAAKARAAIEPYNLALYDQIQAQTAVKNAQAALLEAYDKQKSALQSVVDLQLAAAAATEKQINALKLGAQSILSPEQKYFEAQRQFDAAAPGEAKSAAAQALLEASRTYNGSTQAYVKDYAKVQAALVLQAASQSSAASIAQQQLDALNKQVAPLIGIKDGITGLAATTKAVLDGIQDLARVTAAAAAANSVAGASGSGQSVEAMVAGIYKDVLGRQGDEAGMAFWATQIKNGASYSQIYDALKNSDEYKQLRGISAFANGGLAAGWSLVGEEGPELVNFDQPGRVYTASQSREIMAGGTSDAAIAKQTAAIERQNALIAKQNELLTAIKEAAEETAENGATKEGQRQSRQHMAKVLSTRQAVMYE